MTEDGVLPGDLKRFLDGVTGRPPSRLPGRSSGRSSGHQSGSHRTPQDHPSIALYIAGAVVQIAGLAAVSFQVGEWNFANFTIGTTLFGTFMSFLLRRVGVSTNFLKWGALALAAVFFSAIRRSELFALLVPTEGMLTQEVVLVCALALTATFGSFLLVTDDALIFTCVWAIAMIGLTGTVNVNRELPICFILFLFAAAFLLVHQNSLRFSGANTSEMPARSSRDRWRLLRAQFIMAGAAWSVAIILGTLVAVPVQMVGRNMSLNAILQQLRAPVGINTHPGVPHLNFNDPHAFTVGLGPIEDDPTVHFAVLSDDPHYWRGRTYDHYDGHSWDNTLDPHFGSPFEDKFYPRPPALSATSPTVDARGFRTFLLPAPSPGETIPQRTRRVVTDFHALGVPARPFFHAAEPVLLRAPITSLIVHQDHTLSSFEMDSADYQIESAVSVAHPGDLRRSGYRYPKDIRDHYLNTDLFDASVQALADEAVAASPDNPYDRASNIKRFIAGRCVYSLTARAVPRERDAVGYFLNESHEGYCDLYASAMVALCRCAGIPARVATGYAPGAAVADDGVYIATAPKGDSRKRFILRGSDLHAWAEVYFNRYGWIVFDATEDTAGVMPQARAEETKPKSGAVPRFQRFAIAAVLLAVAIGLAALANEIRLRLLARSPALPSWAHSRGAREMTRAYRAALRQLARRGVRRAPSMTAGEYVALVGQRFGADAAGALRTLTAVEERLLYGNPAATPSADDAESEIAQARAALRALRAALKQNPARKGVA